MKLSNHLKADGFQLKEIADGTGPQDAVSVAQLDAAIAGASGASDLAYIADGALGGHRVVRATTAGKVGYVDPSDPAQAHAALGLTTGAAIDGAPIYVRYGGALTEPSWSWTPNQPIFAGASGIPTQTPPVSGFHAPIGVATSATSMVVQIKTPVVL